jgi:hypothetical protein
MSGSGKGVSVRLSVENTEQVRAALVRLGADGEAALKRLNFDTSTSSGAKLFESTLEEVTAQANGMAGALGPLGSILTGVGGAYLAAGAAVGVFAALIKKSVEAADEEEEAQARIAGVLRATGAASGQTTASIEDMASRVSASTLQTRQDVENAAATLATFRNVGPAAFERTIQAAADMAAVFGGTLQENVMRLGVALDNPIDGMNRLRRAGLDLSPTQKELITNLQETGNIAGAQAALLDDLAQRIGGAGAAQHTGLTGAAHDAGNAWHDFLVELNNTSGASKIAMGAIDGIAFGLEHLRGLNPGAMGLDKQNPHVNDKPQAPHLQPYKVSSEENAAAMGPAIQAAEQQEDLGNALDQSIKNLIQEGSAVGERQRFIDQKLQEIAKANQTTVQQLQTEFPQKVQSIISAAGKDFDASHADQTFNKQLDAADKYFSALQKDVDTQLKSFATLTAGQANAFTTMRSAQDALLVHQLEGQTGYFDAVKRQNDDWLADRLAAIDAEEAKAQTQLDAQAAQYQKDGVAFAQYEAQKSLIAKTAADQRAAVEAQAGSKNVDLQRAQQGPLFPDIQKGSQDLNQSLKGVAADGLNDLQNGFLNVIEGSKNVGKAFRDMAAEIVADLAKMVFEKQVIAPLANLLNGWIDGPGGSGGGIASANGNVFDQGHVMAFATGGIVGAPTMVPMALMGEAGPEAILPLSRGSDGKLGLSSPGGGGAVHNHFSPTININGQASDDQVMALRGEIRTMQRDFFSNSVNAYAQARSRRIVK